MPELRLDLEILEQNAHRIAKEISALNKQWRPHVKSHCQPMLAHKMIELGACGVTAATVDEVSVMAGAGVPSILFAHVAVDETELARLCAAARETELLVCIDHFVQAERYSSAAKANDVSIGVLIDIDIGMQRTGCRPRVDATQLALAVEMCPGLHVAGIFGYEGHLLQIADPSQKKAKIFAAIGMLEQSRDAFLAAGIDCSVVSAGASGSFWITGQHPAVTELQAGGGIFGDRFYSEACGLKNVTPALTVVAEVISRPSLTRAVVNAGRKAINPFVYPPDVANQSDATIDSMSAEHTTLNLEGDGRDLKIGDQVVLNVGYSDHTILMHRTIAVYRGESKVGSWNVTR